MADDRNLRVVAGIDTSSPLFLHPNENPNMALVDPPLTGKNYHSWCRSMRKALVMKNKLGFVNGTIPKPVEDEQLMNRWEQCDTTVMVWISKSVSESIRSSIEMMNSAQEVWDDLQRRYSNMDAFRLSDLLEEIHQVRQNHDSVTDYFARLKTVWNEIMILKPTPSCACVVRCTCLVIPTFLKYNETEYVIRFVKGLNEAFSPVKSQILLMKPLPDIGEAFAMSVQYERQLEYANAHPQPAQGTIFANRLSVDNSEKKQSKWEPNSRGHWETGQRSGNSRKLECTFCGYTGHTIENFYAKNGYPPGWKGRKRVNMAESSDEVGNTYGRSNHIEHVSTGPAERPPGFSAQQWQKISKFLDQLNLDDRSDREHMVNHATVMTANFKHDNNELQGKSTLTWLIDSGATDHVVGSVDLLDHYKKVEGVQISLPTGTIVQVTHIGDVTLYNGLTLHRVLCVPQFKCNLISLSKLTADKRLSILFQDNDCILQDKVTERRIGIAKENEGLYVLKKGVKQTVQKCCNSAKTNIQIIPNKDHLWHMRPGHMSHQRMIVMKKTYEEIKVPDEDSVCHVCPHARMKRLSFPLSSSSVGSVFDLVHMDI